MRLSSESIKSIFILTVTKLSVFTLLILTICRFAWYASNHFWMDSHNFTEILKAGCVGIYFDLPILAWFFLPIWLWLLLFPKKAAEKLAVTRMIYTLSAGVVLLLTAIDCGYSRITARRSGMELFQTLGDEGNHFLPYIKEYWWGVGLLVIAIITIYIIAPVKGKPLYIYIKGEGYRWPMARTLFIFVIWLSAARGGWRTKPLVAIDAAEFVPSALVQFTGSTPLQMIGSEGQTGITNYDFYPIKKAESLVLKPCIYSEAPNKMNVVLIIVESLGRDYTGFLNGSHFTPFLDQLSKKSIQFPYCYANGVRSIEMVPAIFCGIPGMSNAQYINSSFATNSVNNAFKSWQDVGYKTAFFHGGKNGTMRFQAFLAQTGLANYRGLDEYPSELKSKHYDGNWGIFDLPYLQYVKQCLDTTQQPFFTSVFTLSSHHPYTIPAEFRGKLPKGTLPIHQAVAYTDKALESFFKEAAKSPWFDNTLFVITADHTSYSKDAYFYSQSGHYEIPLLIYNSKIKPEVIDKSVSQCDIIPTISDYLKISNHYFGLGRSAFDTTYAGYSLHRDNGINFILHYPYTLGMNDHGIVTDFYQRLRNENTIKPMKKSGREYETMLAYLKSSLQVYSSRLKQNHWYW